MNTMDKLLIQEEVLGVASQMTGCRNAGDYARWAHDQGYRHIEVLNWSSSAGDWQFVVSKDGHEWFIMTQENNWPRPGFTRGVDESRAFFGTGEEVLEEIYNLEGF